MKLRMNKKNHRSVLKNIYSCSELTFNSEMLFNILPYLFMHEYPVEMSRFHGPDLYGLVTPAHYLKN